MINYFILKLYKSRRYKMAKSRISRRRFICTASAFAERTAAALGYNVVGDEVFRTKKREILDKMQKNVYDTLGYTEMAQSLNIPLVNLHDTVYNI